MITSSRPTGQPLAFPCHSRSQPPVHRRLARLVFGLSATLALVCVGLPGVHAAIRTPAASLPALQLPVLQSTSFVRNFNTFSTNALDNKGSIYEPLYIVTYVNNGKQTPWLATAYQWSKDLKTLTFTIRQGVKWSDGQPLTAKDVYYTIMLAKQNPAFDAAGLWTSLGATGVTAVGADKIAIRFKTADVTHFPLLVNNLYILPEHIWSHERDPLHWTNPNPVGSGPFTQVEDFSGQSFALAKNPYYWNKQVVVPALRFTQDTTQDALTLALKAGQGDWVQAVIPQADKVFVAANPRYNHYDYATPVAALVMYPNMTKYPFTLPVFRKALSLAINRTAVWKNAEFGYEPPSDSTGLSGAWPSWDMAGKGLPNTLAQYNPTAAKNMLMKAGFTMRNGRLMDPKGHPVSITLQVTSTWFDWVAAQQIMAQNFKDIGIDAGVKLMQFPQWLDNLQKGNFDLMECCGGTFASPYAFYDSMFGSEWLRPIGTLAGSNNIGRYQNAAMDALFADYRRTLDASQQHALVGQMQKLFIQQLPVIPLVYGALWENYTTRHYTGFPDKGNYYADGRGIAPDRLLVFAHLRPTQ